LSKLRISVVQYLNTAPLVRGFTHGPLQGKYDLSFTVPSQCAEELRTAAADVAIIPAIEYQRIPNLVILPDLSIASKERVLARSTGKDLQFEVVSGKEAKSSGLVSDKTADDAQFIRVHLPGPVPKRGLTRIRIIKTYADAASYYLKDSQLVFERPLGIKRNVVVLPKSWELVGCASPGIVSTDADGRIRVSFLNDRDDQLPVKIVARRLP